MAIAQQTVNERWRRIRSREECDLALSPKSVAYYLKTLESELVLLHLKETLSNLVDYREKERSFHTEDEPSGDLAACEGFETFLIPAVEGVLPFSDFLSTLQGEETQRKFIEAFTQDVNDVLAKWTRGEFSGAPYASPQTILKALGPLEAQKEDLAPFKTGQK
jgi:hypothetical protein